MCDFVQACHNRDMVYGDLRTFWRCVCPACLSAVLGSLKLLSPLQESLGQRKDTAELPLAAPRQGHPMISGVTGPVWTCPAALPQCTRLRWCPLAQQVPSVRPNPTPTTGPLQDGSEDLGVGPSREVREPRRGSRWDRGRGGCHLCRSQAFPETIKGGSRPHRRDVR